MKIYQKMYAPQSSPELPFMNINWCREKPLDLLWRPSYLSKKGRYTSIRSALNRIAAMLTKGKADADTFAWELLRYSDTKEIRNMLVQSGYAPASCRAMLAALYSVLGRAFWAGLMDRGIYLRAVSLPPVRGLSLSPGRALYGEELRLMLEVCGSDCSPSALRDTAAIVLMAGWGLRPFEAVSLDLCDFDPQRGAIKLFGKGHRLRVVRPFVGLIPYLQAWLDVRGTDPGPLLCRVTKDNHVLKGMGMTPQALSKRFKMRVAKAEIKPCTPMDLRRTYVTYLLHAGIPYYYVQQDVGHYRMLTIGRYDKRRELALQPASGKKRLPYVDPTQIPPEQRSHQPHRAGQVTHETRSGWGVRRKREPRVIKPEDANYHRDNKRRLASTCVRKEALPADNNPVKAYLDTLAKGGHAGVRYALSTIAAMATDGRADAETFAWERLQYRDMIGITAMLLDEGYQLSSCKTMMAALRGVLKAAWLVELMDTDSYERAVSLKPIFSPNNPPLGDPLAEDELHRLFEACARDPSPAGRRDAAAIALMAGWGLWPSEAVAVDVDNFDPRDGSIRLMGGNWIERQVFPIEDATLALEAWLAVRGTERGPILCQVRKGGLVLPATRMTPQALTKRLNLRVDQAGIRPCSPKELRRTYISELLDAGVDYVAVQRQVGHSREETTEFYDPHMERAVKRGFEKLQELQVPFVPFNKHDRQPHGKGQPRLSDASNEFFGAAAS